MAARILECTAEQYHADALSPVPTLSRSVGLVLLDRSPAHARAIHPRLGGAARAKEDDEADEADDFDEDEDEKKKDDEKAPRGRGSIFHTLLLAPHEDKREEISFEETDKKTGETKRLIARDFKKKAAQAARKDALARGMVPVREGGMAYGNNGAQRFRESFKRLGIVPADHRCETSIEFEDEGVLCRARLDLIVERPEENQLIIYDPKFMKRGTADMLLNSAIRFGYDMEAHAHIRALEELFPKYVGRVEFVPLACELGSWLVTPHYMGGTMLELGAKRWELARERWRKCLAENRWPAYESEVLEAPQFARMKWGVAL